MTTPMTTPMTTITTKRFKEQHRLVNGMGLKSWARHISEGTSEFSKHAKVWLERKTRGRS